MLKYYLINTACMLVDSFLFFSIKFTKYNRSIYYADPSQVGHVPAYLYVLAAAAVLLTVGVNIAEIVILKKQQKLSLLYIIISAILLAIPYYVLYKA